MNSNELEEGLEIIFNKEIDDLKNFDTIFKEEKQRDAFFVTYSLKKYPNSDRLKSFYYYLENEEDKRSLVNRLKKEIIESNEDEIKVGIQNAPKVNTFNGLSKLCFYTLLKLGFIDEALESLINRKKRCFGLFTMLESISLEHYFTTKQLAKLLSKVDQWNPEYYKVTKNLLLINIKNSRIDKLDQKINFRNIEINQDKKRVSEKITLLGFDERYNRLLAEIDDFLDDGTHKSINSGMINNLRVFTGNLTIDIANKISKLKNEEIPKLPKHEEIGNARKYLKTNLELTDEDDRFIDSFVDILHKKGGHAFLSEKEYFRLSRNIAIEISLFMLSKFEKNKASFIS